MENEKKTVNYEEAVFIAKLAQQTNQYTDCLEFIGPVIEKSEALTLDERCLVSLAFKGILDKIRTSWNSISDLENEPDYSSIKEKILLYKTLIENELKGICKKAIDMIDNYLTQKALIETAEGKVFFMKLKADFYRYMSEVCLGPELEENSNKALDAYLSAKKLASEGLDPINPVRLGLALNFSVFFFEIRKNPKEACQIAKSAFDEATAGLQILEEDSYKDSTYIMQVIKDNLTAWTSDVSEPDEALSRKDSSFIN